MPPAINQKKVAVLTPRLIPLGLILLPLLYLSTLARSLVLGDPTEFTFVANILGIAHPPGYAFITVLGKLFQTLIPFGEIPWRMHILSATVATVAALFVFSSVKTIGDRIGYRVSPALNRFTALLAALSVGTAADHWQHAIHTNPHIITAAFLAANLFFLTNWWAENETSRQKERSQKSHAPAPANKWLFVFCISAGMGVTQHPLTVFAFPAYAIFIVVTRPFILRQWRTLLKMAVFGLLGLSVWLYFPIRSPMEPAFGPSTMNTLNGFLDHILARGLSESLPYYRLVDQPDRALVFWTLLRLQYSLPLIFLAVLGTGWLFVRTRRSLFLLYSIAFVGNYVFIISLKAQDIMAYLLGPFLMVGLLAGVGLVGLLSLIQSRVKIEKTAGALLLSTLFLLGPVLQIVHNAPFISLRYYDEGQAYVDAVFSMFKGRNEGAVLLNDWEHMTPLWYTGFVEGKWPDKVDVRLEFVSAARPWLENVFDFLPGGPVYLSNYRRDVVDAGFRLRPFGPYYQVVEPGQLDLPPELKQVDAQGGEVEIVGYAMPEMAVSAGDYIPLTLAIRSPEGTSDYYVPVLNVGNISFPFTTDSHLVTPDWQPGEVIVERFDFALPHDMAGGEYQVKVDLKNLSKDQEIEFNYILGELTVSPQDHPLRTDQLLANFRQRVGLVSVDAQGNGHRTKAPWNEPIMAHPGDIIRLTARWKSLALAEESYTVFIHLIDTGNRPVVDNLDYTPLGGAFPTHLWFPKWLPGQQVVDPYRMQIPADLAPGTYRIEIGLYEMVGRRRLHISDPQGNLVGDRYILGDVIVGN